MCYPPTGFNPPPAFRKGETAAGLRTEPHACVSIRPPPFGRGKPIHPVSHHGSRNVSIRPPPFGRGKPVPFLTFTTRPGEFQSAPRLSEGGNAALIRLQTSMQSFNPPPAFRKGETPQAGGNARQDWVSIRPPPFGRGKLPQVELVRVGDAAVSIRPPPFGRGKPQLLWDTEYGPAGFNPPPAFRKGETADGWILKTSTDVSIRPPPFGRGKPADRIGSPSSR